MIEINDWLDIATNYTDALVVGNGASIAIDPAFTYSALLGAAREDGLITGDLEALFEYIGTPDFELVLTMLWHAYHVNRALGVDEAATTATYAVFRDALIATVQKHHATYTQIEDKLAPAAEFMKSYRTVVSLNYDLIVYWGNSRWQRELWQLVQGRVYQRQVRSQLGTSSHALRRGRHHTGFYPHGNLALATDLNGEERKLKVPKVPFGMGVQLVLRDLLSEVMKQWQEGAVTPLFVSEGVSAQKIAAINRSAYLRSVFDSVLPKLGESVAIYGWSAAENDQHVLRQILIGSRRLAFSIFRGDGLGAATKRAIEILAQVEKARDALKLKQGTEVRFYWADSAGAWINPAA
jgi:hypothetical protein